MPPEPPKLSAVIPTLNEEAGLPRLIKELRQLGPHVEIVVSDGGSSDRTVAVARGSADHVVVGSPGRGAQLNLGAGVATASVLLFIHADSRLEAPARSALSAWLDDDRSNHQPAVFAFALDAQGPGWRLLEWGQMWRQRLTGIAFGDQGLVVPRVLFQDVGGFPDIPVMEDAVLMKALRRVRRVHTLPARLPTSARRYKRRGRIRSVLANQVLLASHAVGVDPQRLVGAYGPETPEGRAPSHTPTLLVFAKAPIPGRVKTRLARDVGDEAAADLYRVLGSQVVQQVKGGRHRTVVCFDPPSSEDMVRDWLGSEFEFYPQASGDLGDRMEDAVRRSLVQGGPVVVIGTDAPDVDATVVNAAFAALATHDLVVGPAEDGGYYLIGLNTPQPQLFSDIPWSTDEVFSATLRAAKDTNLRTHVLPVLRDIDRLEDVPPAFRTALEI